MTIVLILLVAALAAAGGAFALPRGGRRAQAAAAAGVLALLLIALFAAVGAGPTTATPGSDPSVPPGSAWGGALLPGSYLRLVVTLMALMAALLAAMAWLLGGLAEVTGLLPFLLGAVAGTTVALAASQPVVAALGAAGTGLSAVPVILAGRRPGRTFSALREMRASLLSGALIAVAAAVTEVVMRIVFADPAAASAQSGSPSAAAVGLAALGLGLVVSVRAGAVPFHLRLARLADVVPPISLPVMAAWIPLPLAVAALAVANGLLAPLALPVDTERAGLVLLALVGLGGAALAAFIADDLRHAIAYLVAADSAVVLIALAALDPATSGPARAWLVVVLVAKTALGAWGAVVEDRFGTRALPDLRGWARRAPVLGVALAVVALATYGLPGWVPFEVRDTLPRTAVVEPWSTLLMVAGFLTLPTYVRLLLVVGLGTPAAHVHRAAPERFRHHIGTRARAAGGHMARLGRAAATRVATRASSRATTPRPDGAPVPGIEEPEAATTGLTDTAEISDAAARADEPPAAGVMRARSIASAPDRARAVIGPGMAGLRAAAERGRAIVPSADEVRRGRTELLSAAVLLLALVGALLAVGGLDINQASSEAGGGISTGIEGN